MAGFLSGFTTPIGRLAFLAFPGKALLHGHASGAETKPALTGFRWMYSIACMRCVLSRMKRSQYSRCQTGSSDANREIGVPGAGPPVARWESRTLRAVNFFHEATILATVHPCMGWKRAWT